MRVADDGVGGVDPSVGGGLRGLEDRVAAVGGTLDDRQPGRRRHAAAREDPGAGMKRLARSLLAAPAGRLRRDDDRARAGRQVSGTPSCRARRGRARARRRGADRGRHARARASSKFWAIIRNGVDSAARRLDVLVDYQSPDVFSVERMSALIDQAVATKPDGLVVSIPVRRPRAGDPARGARPASRSSRSTPAATSSARSACSRTSARSRSRAGLEAGRRLADAGVRRAICLNQQVDNTGLDARCAGLARGDARGRRELARARRSSTTTRARRARSPRPSPPTGADGVLATNSVGGLAAAEGLAGHGRQDRHVRPRAGRAQGRRGGPDRLRGRPAALPAGLPADRDARAARALRDLPVAARRRRHGPATSSPAATPRRRSS